jgi:hypothetical protein
MFQPHTLIFASRYLSIWRFDSADYHGPVPRSIRLNLLRYSVTIFPGEYRHFTINRDGWLARKLSNAMFHLHLTQ